MITGPEITVNAVEITKDDPTAIRGQFDSGANATVTNLLIYLHNYQPYTTQFKCSVRLTGVDGTTDIYPLGEGFLHLTAPTPSGYLGVRCFYYPHLSSTLVSPRDILKTSKDWRTGFSGQDMKTYFSANGDPNFGRCTFTCHNKCRQSENISIDGIAMNGNCYTYSLILPEVSIESKLATLLNCLDYALIYDDAFIEKCDKATVHAISAHRKATLQALEDELELQKPPVDVDVDCKQLWILKHFDSLSGVDPDLNPCQSALDATAFRELIIQSIPVNKIRVETERVLWHQRFVHPCDEYLYSTHKFIDGVPKFKQQSNVMSKCSTCIKAKMTKTAPGPNSTKCAVHHGQGLSVDFSFSGVKSKNTGCRKDYVGINGETCWVLITDHHTGMQYGKTCQSKASPIEWLQEWLHVYSPNLKDKYVFIDQGSELYSNPDIVNIFTKH